ncbi:MAG: EamA family transporter [Flavobacteriaceae bacterium]|jgi:drug/metabolite transporter (DMT)-like permease|nr:EamA family transporter [Flavobacteriaceae bacterium]
MRLPHIKWLYLTVLSIVWGSSYILIKWGLVALTPLQLGSLRLLITTIALLLVGYPSLRGLTRYHWKWLAITGYVGTFLPAFLFAFAQQHIESAVAAILNALTPLLTLIFGVLFFKIKVLRKQYLGVAIGLMGSMGLVWGGLSTSGNLNPVYLLLIVMATCCYAINIHFLKIHLVQVGVMAITLGNFIFMAPVALIILLSSDFFSAKTFEHPEIYTSIGYITVLALAGSAFAKYLFNKFVKITTAIFASSVTYTLPIVALFWGISDGETITAFQLFSTVIILFGVYLSHQKKAA